MKVALSVVALLVVGVLLAAKVSDIWSEKQVKACAAKGGTLVKGALRDYVCIKVEIVK